MPARVGSIVIKADIEAMFHMVRVTERDSDSLRFLWTDNIHSNDPPYVLKMLVHPFGAKDSLTCAIHALNQTARDNVNDFSPLAIETVLKSFYVDDLLKSVHDEEVAIVLANELIELLKRGTFRLTKWVSNSSAVLKSIPPSEVATNMLVELDSGNLERPLGALWDVQKDIFTFRFTAREFVNSKRGVLQVTSSIFDPLGAILPFITDAKILFQELWRLELDWDDELPGDHLKQWKIWIKNAENISCVQIPRCYMSLSNQVSEIQLHVFCDASESAYGTVAYIRYSFKGGGHKCALVMAKSKLAPIKTVMIGRLELCSGLIGVRLSKMILHELDIPIERTFYWLDSTLALQYIQNTNNRYKIFVANRVTEILEHSQKEQWNHVPGVQNPADMLTRGVKDPSDLMRTNKFGTSWFGATEFLEKDEVYWPHRDIEPLDSNDVEIKQKAILVALGFMITSKQYKFDVLRFSSWNKVRRVAAWFLRIVQLFRDKLFHIVISEWKKNGTTMENLSYQEVHRGECFIIQDVQSVIFEREIRCLKAGEELHSRSQLASLTPFIQDNLLRVGGSLSNACIAYDAKHPVILPKKHHLTEIIIMKNH